MSRTIIALTNPISVPSVLALSSLSIRCGWKGFFFLLTFSDDFSSGVYLGRVVGLVIPESHIC